MRTKNSALSMFIIAALAIAAGIFIYHTMTVRPGARPVASVQADGLRCYFIDVGQGDSSLFIFPDGKTLLIDAGPEDRASGLVSFIKSLGVTKIDILAATHAHSDHIGGMQAVLKAFPVGRVWDSGFIHGSRFQINFYQTVKDKKIQFGRPKRGFKEEMGGGLIEVTAPAKEMKGTGSDVNNNSLVLRVSYGSASFLVTGDMARAERMSVSPLPASSVLKAAHHGSSDGTDARTIYEVKPSAVVLSYARGNPYGHPHREVVRLLKKHPEIMRFDTADGTVGFSTDGKTLSYQKDREVKPR